MGMGSVFTRYAGLRCLFIQNTLGVNAYRHIENAINYNSRNKTLYREQSTSVRLAYSIYSKEGSSSGSPVLIVHGLMGSRMNWNSVSKAIVSKINRNVIAIDARNHGDSAHSPDMTYGHMVEDLRLFVDELKLGRVCPIGHSMGGKVVMLFALTHVPAVCQFLAMNVTQAENGEMKWKVNLDTLVDTFDEIASFPATEKVFEGPTYFIGGGDSDYMRKEDEQEIKKIFPSATFKYIPGAGHWVHADKPNEFVEEVCRFLTGK
ncbi:protein ABHD11-like isoform X2 [Schistocerca nitens]|uniref:protein ABHD11-like isoform X2 n=1 Tax=Schistocerca nitens TaxID=7011 RepID=UPI0021197A88|nr:protein ABHD11-like isoform X2 [Schistocerca nitens]